MAKIITVNGTNNDPLYINVAAIEIIVPIEAMPSKEFRESLLRKDAEVKTVIYTNNGSTYAVRSTVEEITRLVNG